MVSMVAMRGRGSGRGTVELLVTSATAAAAGATAQSATVCELVGVGQTGGDLEETHCVFL